MSGNPSSSSSSSIVGMHLSFVASKTSVLSPQTRMTFSTDSSESLNTAASRQMYM